MATKSQRPKRREDVLSSLNAAIDALNLAKEVSTIAPAKAAFCTTSGLLTTIRVIQESMVDEVDYVKLGLACAEVCKILDRGMNRRREDQLSQPALGQSSD